MIPTIFLIPRIYLFVKHLEYFAHVNSLFVIYFHLSLFLNIIPLHELCGPIIDVPLKELKLKNTINES